MDSLLEQIDLARLMNQIEQLATIGSQASGGVTRLAFSREDQRARALLLEFMQEAGLEIRRDPVGNIIGTRRGAQPSAPVVATGSHIDTVVNAGKLDGVVGTLAAVECARVLNAHHPLRASLQVICFAMEESARFGGGYGFGSRAMVGQPISDREIQGRDVSGRMLARAMQELKAWEEGKSFEPIREDILLDRTRQDILDSRRDFSKMAAFLELHIEQGPVLDKLGKRIGIVRAVAAPTRLKMTFTGQQNHSGTTPMDSRRDALAAAAEAILAVERISQQNAPKGMVGTVGVIQSHPGSINVIPGRAEIGVDLRGIDAKAKREMTNVLIQAVEAIGEQRSVGISITVLTEEEPVSFSPEVVQTIEAVCAGLGIDAHRMPSGAGHDAAHLAQVTDAGMIFVPSIGGISHDPREATSPDDIRLGTQVLLATLLHLAA